MGCVFVPPEETNSIIRRLVDEYGAALADIQAEFEQHSPYGIIGNTLICDHLHPTVEGYQLMGKVFLHTDWHITFCPRPLMRSKLKPSIAFFFRLHFPYWIRLIQTLSCACSKALTLSFRKASPIFCYKRSSLKI